MLVDACTDANLTHADPDGGGQGFDSAKISVAEKLISQKS